MPGLESLRNAEGYASRPVVASSDSNRPLRSGIAARISVQAYRSVICMISSMLSVGMPGAGPL